MSTPFYMFDVFGDQTSYVIAFALGIAFGFVLERAGFGSSRKLAMQFYFRDMTVLKVMFSAIVTTMVGLFYLNLVEIFDFSMLYLNTTYIWPQVAGGVIMGLGFVIGGYCPGTSLVASATGKIDGIVYVLGALFGIFVFAEIYPLIQDFHNSGFLGDRTVNDWLNLSPGLIAFFVVIMALGMFVGAEYLEKKFRVRESV